jgi:subtilisin family serine protease
VLKEDAGLVQSDLQTRNAKVKEKAYGLLKKYEVSGNIEEVYETALQGFTVKMAPGQMKKMGGDLDVKYIEADKVISLSPINATGKPVPQPVAESVPWGITRVNGGTSGVGKRAWIIDSGIDLDHPDLTVDLSLSRSFLGGTSTADDQNGHGTHVAGTIAAKDNTIGVVGVAAGATVVAVRVLDRRGSGSTSGVIAGVNYVAGKASFSDVANMSLGGGVSESLDEAVLAASAKVQFTLAAGNETDNANNHSPARVNGANIFTISAMDSADKFAYFSNYGNPPVEYCAPGVSIKSTYKDGGYATLSGTSMAAPPVAGILLLVNNRSDSQVLIDLDGNIDPIAEHLLNETK